MDFLKVICEHITWISIRMNCLWNGSIIQVFLYYMYNFQNFIYRKSNFIIQSRVCIHPEGWLPHAFLVFQWSRWIQGETSEIHSIQDWHWCHLQPTGFQKLNSIKINFLATRSKESWRFLPSWKRIGLWHWSHWLRSNPQLLQVFCQDYTLLTFSGMQMFVQNAGVGSRLLLKCWNICWQVI